MLRDERRMEILEEFDLVNISFGGLLRKQSRRWCRVEFYVNAEVWMD